MQSTTEIDSASTVNQVIARYPATIAVFNRFGIDTCCGGAEPIADAARRDGADLEALLTALRGVVELR
jgi:regulator of cell morphogenesis and NO signaling